MILVAVHSIKSIGHARLAIDLRMLASAHFKPRNNVSLRETLHLPVNLSHNTFINSDIKNLDILKLELSSQHRRQFPTITLPT